MKRITPVLAALTLAAGLVVFAPTPAQAAPQSDPVCHVIVIPGGAAVVCAHPGLPVWGGKATQKPSTRRYLMPVRGFTF